jgi:hypothetical protein
LSLDLLARQGVLDPKTMAIALSRARATALATEARTLVRAAWLINWDSTRGYPYGLHGPDSDVHPNKLSHYTIEFLPEEWQRFNRVYARIREITTNHLLCPSLRTQLQLLLRQNSYKIVLQKELTLGGILSRFIQKCKECQTNFESTYWWAKNKEEGCMVDTIPVYLREAEKIYKTLSHPSN